MATREEELEIMESNIRQMEDDCDIPIWRRGHAIQMLVDRNHYRAVCAEVESQAEARRRALKVADERSKENCALRQENERLTAALKPFAAVGQPFIAAAASGAFPAGASARLMRLEPLTVQQFIDAARALEQTGDQS